VLTGGPELVILFLRDIGTQEINALDWGAR
jgi:hypothetical protein